MPRAAPDRGKGAAWWRYAALAVGGLGGALFVLDGWELQLTATARESRLLAAVQPRAEPRPPPAPPPQLQREPEPEPAAAEELAGGAGQAEAAHAAPAADDLRPAPKAGEAAPGAAEGGAGDGEGGERAAHGPALRQAVKPHPAAAAGAAAAKARPPPRPKNPVFRAIFDRLKAGRTGGGAPAGPAGKTGAYDFAAVCRALFGGPRGTEECDRLQEQAEAVWSAPNVTIEREPVVCEDTNPNCPAWAANGECQTVQEFMREQCCQSCGGQAGTRQRLVRADDSPLEDFPYLERMKLYFSLRARNHPSHFLVTKRHAWNEARYDFDRRWPGWEGWQGPQAEVAKRFRPGSLYEQLAAIFPSKDPRVPLNLDAKFPLPDTADRAVAVAPKPCPGGCHNAEGHGVCDPYSGRCQCFVDWEGEDCGTPLQGDQGCNKPDWSWNVNYCAHTCKSGLCFCGAETKHPERQAFECGYAEFYLEELPEAQRTEASTTFGTNLRNLGLDKKAILGENGWCNADHGTEPRRICPCAWPKWKGRLCDLPVMEVCVNQCSGHGRCDRGSCICDPGFHGADCSLDRGLNTDSRFYRVPTQYGGKRKRPLIYVYELPPEFNARTWNHRRNGLCTAREFAEGNSTDPSHFYYPLEHMLHEWLLNSEHRTNDPEEADFFYVPVYSDCYRMLMDDRPGHSTEFAFRGLGVMQMLMAAHGYVSQTFPYWNRTGGADHIWVQGWDEGACTAPEVIRSSILIDHFGALYGSDGVSRTAYGQDNWAPLFPPHLSEEETRNWKQAMVGKAHPELFEWRGPRHARGKRPCFEPGKDIVMPMYKVRKAAQLRPPGAKRSQLFFFAGDLGREGFQAAGKSEGGRIEFQYSHGIRQALAKLWAGREDVGMHIHAGSVPDYQKAMQDSVFCGVMPGDGWSGAIIDYLNNGCIPVHLHDTVTSPYEGYLDIQEFSLKVPEVNLTNLPYLLADVPEWRVRQLQEGGRRVNSRFTYGSYHEKVKALLKVVGSTVGPADPSNPRRFAPSMHYRVPNRLPGPDAFDTLIPILYHKLLDRHR